jgi:hypothetical protein
MGHRRNNFIQEAWRQLWLLLWAALALELWQRITVLVMHVVDIAAANGIPHSEVG